MSSRRLPDDIKYVWLNVVRRMQSCVKIFECPAILTIRVIIDERGIPVRWLTPTVESIEPKNSPLEQIERLLPGSDLATRDHE